MNPAVLAHALAVDSAALDAAASIAEEALACHREALILLAEGWQSETGSAIRDFMDRQCVHASDVVDALRGAPGVVETPPDACVDWGGDRAPVRTAGPTDAGPLPPDTAGSAADPANPMVLPAPTPGPVPPSTGQAPASPWTMPASPWTMPTAADPTWASAGLPGGLPTAPAAPALPDLGGTLAGLVAEIAQALGSYADVAPSVEPPSSPADPSADAPMGTDNHSTGPIVPDPAPATALTDSATPRPEPAAPAGAPATAPPLGPTATGPTSTPSPPEPLPPAPPELLAAERAPDPRSTGAPAPAPDAAAPAPPPAYPTPDEPAAAQPPAETTPCEIAADELPKVGE